MIEVDDARLSRYQRRIAEEKSAAEAASTAEAKRIHMELMLKYEQLLAGVRAR